MVRTASKASHLRSFRSGLLWVLLAAGVVFLGAGCTSEGQQSSGQAAPASGGAERKAVVEFWHAMSGEHERLIAEMADDFEKANPGIEVNPVYQGQYNQLKINLSNALATGSSPALAQVYETWTSLFLEKKHLTPVQKFIDAEPDGYKAVLDDIYPAFLENNKWDGTIVTLPFNKSAYILTYNVDRFKKAGYESFPTTLPEIWAAAGKTTQRDAGGDIVCYGIGIRTTLEPFTELLLLYGGGYLEQKDGAIRLFDPEIARKALGDLVMLNVGKKVAYTTAEYLSSPFGSDTIAFFSGSSAGIPFVEKGVGDKFQWAAAAWPDASGTGKGRHLFQGTNIAIFSLVSAAEQEAAWKFLKFILEPEQAAKWAARSGYLPVRRAALGGKILADYAASSQPYQVCVAQLETAAFEPKARDWEEIRNEIVTEIESAVQGRTPIDDTIRNCLKKAETIIAENAASRR